MKITKIELLEKLQVVYKEAGKLFGQNQEVNQTNKTDENEYVETAELSDDEELENIAKSIYELLDRNSDNVIDNEELSKIKNILEDAGLNFSIFLDCIKELGGEIADEVSEIKTSDLEDIDLDKFKELIVNYPRLNELVEQIGYEEVFNLIDTNNNKTIEAEELEAIVKNGNPDALSKDDIEKLLNQNGYKIEENEITTDTTDPEGPSNDIPSYSASPFDSSYAGGSYSSGGSYAGGSYGGSYGSSSNGLALADTVEGLEEQKSEQADKLTTLNSTLRNALRGEGEVLSGLKADMDEKEEIYQNLLSNEAKDNPEIASKRTDLMAEEEGIDTCEKNIATKEIRLNNIENSITAKNTEIAALTSARAALQLSLDSLDNTKVTDENRDEIDAKRIELTGLIGAKDEEIRIANADLERLERNKGTVEKEISDLNRERDEHIRKRDSLESDIEKLVSDTTKTALSDYQKARETFESKKEATISSTRDEIQQVQNTVNEIDVKINRLKAAEIKKTHMIDPYSMWNREVGEAIAEAAQYLNGSKTRGNSNCAGGVSEALKRATGYRPYKNGNNYWEALVGRDDWYEVTDTVNSVEDLKNLPAGAIVSWSEYNTTSLGRLYGHVYICDGNGYGISDFKETITDYYMSRNASWRVFIPV